MTTHTVTERNKEAAPPAERESGATTVSGQDRIERYAALSRRMEGAGDNERAAKFRGLIEKWREDRVYLAFCGHFSAGKSTLINRLCGHSLLPSSPIPTSANVVSIANGPESATVYRRRGTDAVDSVHGASDGEKANVAQHGEAQAVRVPIEDLAQYCVDGKEIERVEITYPLPFLGDDAALLDTPGVDSTDAAHELATESALYLADVVFYVMDYNHVQSEMNLAFAKQMTERGKPLYLVVNMIDKHREEELAFEAYRAGAEGAFAAWGIEPDGVLYVSTKTPRHPRSEWYKLRALAAQLISRGAQLRAYGADQAARQLLAEHRSWRTQVRAARKAELSAALQGDDGAHLAARRDELLRAVGEAQQAPQRLIAALRREAAGIADNAGITPAVTRDTAHEYLQSRKPGFKAGLFAGAAKTAAEVAARLAKLHAEFARDVDTQLKRHLQTMLREAAERDGIESAEAMAAVESVDMAITPEWLAEQVNTQAVFGNEYTMTYMKQVAAEVKSVYRRRTFDAIDQLAAELETASAVFEREAAQELDELNERLAAYDAIAQMERQEAEEDREAAALLGDSDSEAERPVLPRPADIVEDARIIDDAEPTGAGPEEGAENVSLDVVLRAAHTYTGERRADADGSDAAPNTVPADTASAAGHSAEAADAAKRRARRYNAAAAELAEIAALRPIARSLQEKAGRLLNRTYTVALFGAFSAGKSSLANALIGERVLPVSPNPTTAAINKIVPPQEGWPHGTAKVTMKTIDAVWEDIKYSLGLLGSEAEDMTSALNTIAQLAPDDVPPGGKAHYAFLKAVAKGWMEAEPDLGRELRTDREQFAQYVAEEAKSCFVDHIELHHANALTDLGVVFVDTPGADSINARHTGVAFNYIKNADAILFVTYYNHAFSQADKEFLMQLGRVKDEFELDKMFFIVNAADLASSADELQGVLQHVESNLLTHGIRRPRLYPVSSQMAIDGKLQANQALLAASGLPTLESQFAGFVFNELSGITARAAESELTRGLHALDRLIQGLQADESERLRQIETLQRMRTTGADELNIADVDAMQRELGKEIAELLYYVRQRTMLRYSDFYTLSFNPAVFRDERKDVKALLQSAWNELRRMIAYDLEQEGLATTLRVEKAINKLAASQYERWRRKLESMIEGFDPGDYEAGAFQTPAVSVQLDMNDVTMKLLGGYFKNAKQFFEGDGRAKLKQELEDRLHDAATAAVNRLEAQFTGLYADHLNRWLDEQRGRLSTALSEHLDGSIDALGMNADIDLLLRKREQVRRFASAN